MCIQEDKPPLGVGLLRGVVTLFRYLASHLVGTLSEDDRGCAPMTKAPWNNSEHALCFMKWDCKNPLKTDVPNSIKTQFPLMRHTGTPREGHSTLSATVSAFCHVVLPATDINPLRVRGSFIFPVKSLNTIIDFCVQPVSSSLHLMRIVYINAQSPFHAL